MTENQRKLINILKDMFHFNQADLDFGIYRIMRLKRDEINRFIEEDLPLQITEGLNELAGLDNATEIAAIDKQIADTKAASFSDAVKAAAITELEEKKKALAGVDVSSVEADIYNHLTNFFSRYYDDGDFISQRRYKDGAYAIPYEGEEVKLHWANADQYYVKTSEYFKDYTFKTAYGDAIQFKLIEAETERDNNKANQKRYFQLHTEKPFEEIDGVLNIFIEYKNGGKKNQAECISEIVSAFGAVQNLYPSYASIMTIKDGKTELERQLIHYTARNTFDYFIHKDLGKFLNRELDFYIKNDVIFLDDIDEQDETKVKEYLTKAKVIRKISRKIIAFLEQIENFQKKLYLKKKFVVETNYCITLDRIPEILYPEIAENDAQREEWVRLFSIDDIIGNDMFTIPYSVPLSVDFLKANPFLVLDTAFFSTEFKEKLISEIDGLDDSLDGLMIHSENSQAIRLLQEKYRQKIKCTYIDPPYNSPSSEILYKNNFKHSSWISMMHNRLEQSRLLSTEDGSIVIAIDKHEHNWLFDLCKQLFPNYDVVSVAVEHNKKGTQGDHFSFSNEYAIFVIPYALKKLNETIRPESEWEYSNFRNWGSESERSDAANCFYPVYVQNQNIIGYGPVLDENIHPGSPNITATGIIEVYTPEAAEPIQIDCSVSQDIIAVYPIDDSLVERKWRYAFQSIGEIFSYLKVETSRSGNVQIKMPKYSDQFKTMWYSSLYNAGDYGTKILSAMGFTKNDFEYPKSIYTVKDCIYAVSGKNDIVFDYFAGSGTTGQVVIDMNRSDNGNRKYILVEMGEYFYTTTKPRVQKSIYSVDKDDLAGWKDGKPISRIGSSHAFKYIRLESYEDSLNNIILRNGDYDLLGLAREGFVLSYMLDAEAEGASMLNIDKLNKPFNYTMNITRNLESVECTIDLVETFNYLIGLTVNRSYALTSYDADFSTAEYGSVSASLKDGNTYKFKTVDGVLPNGDNALIIWREMTDDMIKDNAALDAYFLSIPNSRSYRKVFVNCNNNLLNLRDKGESWQVVLIDEEMKKRMFDIAE
ncbi:MAG: site-specific DNA-methyltransferase [Firmicutes bacterium]|nr:site-specific DNA-methyltransferase [Bacillota bacterium]